MQRVRIVERCAETSSFFSSFERAARPQQNIPSQSIGAMQAALELRILARSGPARLAKLKVSSSGCAHEHVRVSMLADFSRSCLIMSATRRCSCQLARELPRPLSVLRARSRSARRYGAIKGVTTQQLLQVHLI